MYKIHEIKEKVASADEFYLENAVGINKEELDWLIQQVEKFQRISDTWKNNINDADYETVQFLRVCKEEIEGVEVPKRNKRT